MTDEPKRYAWVIRHPTNENEFWGRDHVWGPQGDARIFAGIERRTLKIMPSAPQGVWVEIEHPFGEVRAA